MTNKKVFKNPPGGPRRKFSLYKRLFFFLRRLFDLPPDPPKNFILSSAFARRKYNEFFKANTLSWLGHSTFLIKLNNTTILTDPFLTTYASPIYGLGPKRYSPPGMNIEDLPPIDIIIISHDHYDHCDLRTLIQIPNKSNIDVIVPLRLGKLLRKIGYQHVHELDWHQSWEKHDIIIRALPAYHYSKRNLFTRNITLWASFAITTKRTNIFFSGDTAYGSVFKELGKQYGPFDYSILSIGCYEPEDFMLSSHLSPEQAVQVGQELKSKTLVAMHWGTIILSDEPALEPPLRFYHAAQTANYPYYDIWIYNIGETKVLSNE